MANGRITACLLIKKSSIQVAATSGFFRQMTCGKIRRKAAEAAVVRGFARVTVEKYRPGRREPGLNKPDEVYSVVVGGTAS